MQSLRKPPGYKNQHVDPKSGVDHKTPMNGERSKAMETGQVFVGNSKGAPTLQSCFGSSPRKGVLV